MNKFSLIFFIFFGIILLSGCGERQIDQNNQVPINLPSNQKDNGIQNINNQLKNISGSKLTLDNFKYIQYESLDTEGSIIQIKISKDGSYSLVLKNGRTSKGGETNEVFDKLKMEEFIKDINDVMNDDSYTDFFNLEDKYTIKVDKKEDEDHASILMKTNFAEKKVAVNGSMKGKDAMPAAFLGIQGRIMAITSY